MQDDRSDFTQTRPHTRGYIPRDLALGKTPEEDAVGVARLTPRSLAHLTHTLSHTDTHTQDLSLLGQAAIFFFFINLQPLKK